MDAIKTTGILMLVLCVLGVFANIAIQNSQGIMWAINCALWVVIALVKNEQSK